MHKRRTAIGLIRLTRYKEFLIFALVTTLMGFIFSNAPITLRSLLTLGLVLLANLLSLSFSFMINDVEDAHDDSLNPDKRLRNPVSAGIISHRIGYVSAVGVALFACILFYPLGRLAFGLGIASVIISGLYSWKMIRLKNIPVIDLISHGFMLAGLQFLCSYFSFIPTFQFELPLILPLLLIVSLSMYGELYNELRDMKYDKIAGITHTAAFLGEKATKLLIIVLFMIAAASIILSIWFHLLPLWFLITFIGLGILFMIQPFLFPRNDRKMTDAIHDNTLITTFLCLVLWVIIRTISLP